MPLFLSCLVVRFKFEVLASFPLMSIIFARFVGEVTAVVQDAATRGDENKVQNLLERYHALGGEKQLWMFDMLINMHARKRNLAGALAVRDLMHELGLKGSTCVTHSNTVHSNVSFSSYLASSQQPYVWAVLY